MVGVPTEEQVKVVAAFVALDRDPDDADHANETGLGRESRSLATPLKEIVPPTGTDRGCAESASTFGQTLIVPSISTPPVRTAPRHWRCTATAVVALATTSNVAEPAQVVPPSAETALRVIE